MDPGRLIRVSDHEWQLPRQRAMPVPGIIYADGALIRGMDDKVCQQVANVATLPGIVGASYAMSDAHWGCGFPIVGVAAFDPDEGGVISARDFGLAAGDVVASIHCGSRGRGHQMGTEFLRAMALTAQASGIDLPDRELACVSIRSAIGVARVERR